jgi:hypothetical protein
MTPRPPSDGGVSSPYGMRTNPNDGKYRMHYGEDTLGVGNYAPVSGTVVFAGYDTTGTGLGWCVIIQQQGTGTKTVPQVMWAVAHHGTGKGAGPSPLKVRVGQQVVEGVTYLGPKGDSGAAQGVHAHTERRHGGQARPGTGTATNPRDHYTSTAGGGTTPFENGDTEMRAIREPGGGIALVGETTYQHLNLAQWQIESKIWGSYVQLTKAEFDKAIADTQVRRAYLLAGVSGGGGASVDADAIARKVEQQLADDLDRLSAQIAEINTEIGAPSVDDILDGMADRLKG